MTITRPYQKWQRDADNDNSLDHDSKASNDYNCLEKDRWWEMLMHFAQLMEMPILHHTEEEFDKKPNELYNDHPDKKGQNLIK